MNNNKVSIATKPLVYSAFRYIENKVWNALAEYVDNAVQSFKDHIDILKNINPNGKLRVDINIDIEQDIITITDNAFGITNENYDRAFELANIPLDRKGLNEFGMGMKVSSIWLSDHARLAKMGVQYRQGGAWILYAKYQGNGYTHTVSVPYMMANGEQGTQIQTRWTEKGRKFLHDLMDGK